MSDQAMGGQLLGRLPPDEAAVRKAREAATGSDELHFT
jgi:hypothetical protein